jgi:membrane-bound lytic murein transglycosylase D
MRIKTALTLLAFLPLAMQAQLNNNEIEVIDAEGNDEAFDFPEALADSNLDSLMNLYMTKTYLMSESDCEPTRESPVFSREEYIDRLQRMPTVMEMPYNEVVRSCIDRYVVRLRRQVSYMLGASNFYMPIFEEALDAYQLPLELKYLPIIESALNPTAVSRAGATGLWQFMLGTAKMYNLEVNSLVDERRDPVKSSYAAAHFLSDLYKIFGDWNLVIAAYNCGPENINKAIRRSGGERDYWKIYPYLPKETRGYVPAFIAANYAMNYYCEHGICPMASKLPAKTDTVVVDRNVTFAQIASMCDYDIEMIRSLNPVYKRDVVAGLSGQGVLRLPLNEINRFIDMQDSIYKNAPILKRAEVEIDEKPTPQQETRRNNHSGRRGNRASYATVRRGDTLSGIARRNGTTVANIKRLNGLRSNTIRSGQRLRVK